MLDGGQTLFLPFNWVLFVAASSWLSSLRREKQHHGSPQGPHPSFVSRETETPLIMS